MAIFKCKMCGGDLDVSGEEKVIECEYCGTSQTVPAADNEKKVNLFNRANRLRMANEFDKAAGVYESIVAEFPNEAEAYWGLCLCKYGIEYVDDEATACKIPTCHRTSYDSILEDNNYKLAVERTDPIAARMYNDEAKKIDEIQKAILAIVGKEEPFDIFICYKETAEDGQRTKDSVLAQEMYDALTGKGYKVFFSRITLESRLGTEFEPYIFAALNSAKVMLAVGTKSEYYNAVWVKNEWNRFLDLMKKDKEKKLIPCYTDMDAYDMPAEFKNLQGQDMGKVGFIQDIVRGIEKIIPLQTGEAGGGQTIVQQIVTGSGVNYENLLKRGMLALEDRKWDEADKFFDRVLDENVECGDAYLGKLMLKMQVRDKNELYWKCENEFDMDDHDLYEELYGKLTRFGNEEQKKFVENISIWSKYNQAIRLMSDENGEDEYKIAIHLLKNCGDYKDSKDKLEECTRKIEGEKKDELYKKAVETATQEYLDNQTEAIRMFEELGNWRDSIERIKQCKEKMVEIQKKAEERMPLITRHRLHKLAAGADFSVRVFSNGEVRACGDNSLGQCNVSQWRDVISVAAGYFHTIALKKDGTVVATGANRKGQCNVSEWRDIVAIAAGPSHSVGVKSDGSVVATGDNEFNQCDVNECKDVVAVATSMYATAVLKRDGNVIILSSKVRALLSEGFNIKPGAVAVSMGDGHMAALNQDGTVGMIGVLSALELNSVAHWKNIRLLSTFGRGVIGVTYSGEVLVEGDLLDNTYYDVSDWTRVVEVAGGWKHILGLKDTGFVLATGDDSHGQSKGYNLSATLGDKTTESSSGSGGACYVATCVYGSYDCPEVWTLRRFRDDTLAETWYGRAFVRLYYAVSPTLVKWFGKTAWFKKLWKGPLEHMVHSLREKGVEDTPYDDKQW